MFMSQGLAGGKKHDYYNILYILRQQPFGSIGKQLNEGYQFWMIWQVLRCFSRPKALNL